MSERRAPEPAFVVGVHTVSTEDDDPCLKVRRFDLIVLAVRFEEDPVSQALSAMRVAGAIVVREAYGAPWRIRIPGASDLAAIAIPSDEARVVAFHLVQRGWLELVVAGQRRTVRGGEVAVCFGGDPHTLLCGRGGRAVSLQDILLGRDGPDPPGSDRETTELVCGIFVLRDVELNPLFSSLPSVLTVDCERGPAMPFARLLTTELRGAMPGQAFVLHRTLEVLCAGLVRGYLETIEETSQGFLAGIKDERIRPVLAEIHAAPAQPWTLARMSTVAGLSRSSFAARFTRVVGGSAMGYVTRWRMNVAARLLRDGDETIESIAERVGYESVPAFSRAFRRTVGASPARYRRAA